MATKKGKMRNPYDDGILIISKSISWLWYSTIVLQVVTIVATGLNICGVFF